jgi:hypothetical protein
MEYWPIRQYFLNTAVNDDELIGFFSPRFNEKTGLNSNDVYTQITNNPGYDIYLFNPYFHLASWHNNPLVQAEPEHNGITDLFNQLVTIMGLPSCKESYLTSSKDTVYCNYFVAKRNFWEKWLCITEFLFHIAEDKENSLGKMLRDETNYHRKNLPVKIFIIERVASYMLNTFSDFTALAAYLYKSAGFISKKEIHFWVEMHKLDALKIAFQSSGNRVFFDVYNSEKIRLIKDYDLKV